jgi:hypothetical protein
MANQAFTGSAMMKNNLSLLLMLCCIFFAACKKAEVIVQTDAPPAIQELVRNLKSFTAAGCGCHPYVKQYTWRNTNVYMSGNNDALNIGYICDWIPMFYNSEGKRFEIDGAYSFERFQDFQQTSRYIRTVWACE